MIRLKTASEMLFSQEDQELLQVCADNIALAFKPAMEEAIKTDADFDSDITWEDVQQTVDIDYLDDINKTLDNIYNADEIPTDFLQQFVIPTMVEQFNKLNIEIHAETNKLSQFQTDNEEFNDQTLYQDLTVDPNNTEDMNAVAKTTSKTRTKKADVNTNTLSQVDLDACQKIAQQLVDQEITIFESSLEEGKNYVSDVTPETINDCVARIDDSIYARLDNQDLSIGFIDAIIYHLFSIGFANAADTIYADQDTNIDSEGPTAEQLAELEKNGEVPTKKELEDATKPPKEN